MRLQPNEIAKIREVISKEFGDSQIYIFGSQLDIDKRGGDIDILIHSDFDREIEQMALKGIKI